MSKYFITNDPLQDLFGLEPLTIVEVVERISDKQWLSMDTETSGLSPIDDILTMIQIFDGTNTYIIDAQSVDVTPLNTVMKDTNITKIFHNAKFDIKFLKQAQIGPEKVFCTMLADKVIHCGKNMRFSLADLLLRYFDIEMSKEVRGSFIGHKGTFTKAQIEYGIDDVAHLINIVRKQKPQIDRLNLQKVIDLENEAVLAFADIEYNGLYLDKDAWSKVADAAKEKADTLFYKMDMEVYKRYPQYHERQLDMFGLARPVTINWDSPSQVLELFKIKYKNLDSVNAKLLKSLGDPLVKDYVQYKEASKAYNAYGPEFYKYLHSDGKVHTNFNQVLFTGRVSSSGPNLQQIPSDNIYRNAFKPKEDGWKMVSSDFSAQELCVIAYGSKDPVWLDVLRNGGDLHSRCAELVFGDAWLKLGKDTNERKATEQGQKLRKHVKTINFGLAYGMGAASVADQLGITKKQAKKLIDKYYEVFPRIKGFLDMAGEYGVENGFIRTFRPYGRIRHFENWDFELDNETKAQITRWSKNTPIQGSAADMTKEAMVLIRKYLNDNNLNDKVKMVCAVHDQVDTECSADIAEEWAVKLTELMEQAGVTIVGEGLLKAETDINNAWTK